MSPEDESSGSESVVKKRKFDVLDDAIQTGESPSQPNRPAGTTVVNLTSNDTQTCTSCDAKHSPVGPHFASLRNRYSSVSLESLRSIKNHLLSLATKNRDIRLSMQRMRESVVKELLEQMRVRQMAIGQLTRPNLGDDLRQLCQSTMAVRLNYMVIKETELMKLEELLGGHHGVLDIADAACTELNVKVTVQIDRIGRGEVPGELLAGRWCSLAVVLDSN